jgi:hypothetical protein
MVWGVPMFNCSQAIWFNQNAPGSILKKPQSMVHMIGGVVGGEFGAKNDRMPT